jgi:hypothetical protein
MTDTLIKRVKYLIALRISISFPVEWSMLIFYQRAGGSGMVRGCATGAGAQRKPPGSAPIA